MRTTGGSGVVPSSGGRLPGVEGLRALAACSILVNHAWFFAKPPGPRADLGPLNSLLPDLAFGVTLFFALSGFLLYRPFAAALLRGEGRVDVGRYLRNRALRILPAYWVILLVCGLVLGSTVVYEDGALVTGAMTDPQLLARNLLLLHSYGPASVTTGIGPTWSLSVEFVFYLALPLLAGLAWILARRAASRRGRSAAVLAPAALLLVLGLSGKAAAAWVFPAATASAGWDATWHTVLERSFWCQADLFAFGMALAVVHVEHADGRLRLPDGWRPVAALTAVGGYALTAVMTGPLDQLGPSAFNTLMALACALGLALVVLPPRRAAVRAPLVRLLDTRILTWLGLISYSIFLWHEPLARWLAEQGLMTGGSAGFFLNVAILASLTLALSALTHRFVELPALRRKRATALSAGSAPAPTAVPAPALAVADAGAPALTRP